jgi:uncharacterized protein
MFNRAELIDLLLEHGADPSKRAADGSTALSLAQSQGAEAATARLIRAAGNES